MNKGQIERKLDRLVRRKANLKQQANRIITSARMKSDSILSKAQYKVNGLENIVHRLENDIDFLKEKLGYHQ